MAISETRVNINKNANTARLSNVVAVFDVTEFMEEKNYKTTRTFAFENELHAAFKRTGRHGV